MEPCTSGWAEVRSELTAGSREIKSPLKDRSSRVSTPWWAPVQREVACILTLFSAAQKQLSHLLGCLKVLLCLREAKSILFSSAMELEVSKVFGFVSGRKLGSASGFVPGEASSVLRICSV